MFMTALDDLKRGGRDHRRSGAGRSRRRSGGARRAARAAASSTTSTAISRAQGDRVPVKTLDDDHQVAAIPPVGAAPAASAQEGTEHGPDTPGVQGRSGVSRSRSAPRSRRRWTRRTLDAFVYPTWSNPPRLIGDLNTPHGDNSQVFSPTTGLPRDQRADGLHARQHAAGRHHVLRPRVGRGDADQARLRVRTGDKASAEPGQSSVGSR